MDKIKSLLITLLAVVIIGIVSGDFFTSEHQPSGRQNGSNYDEVLIFPSDRYPETGAHIRKAIKKGTPKSVRSTGTEPPNAERIH